jgi:DNA-binding Lrp family transcriptional regulator
MDSKDFQLLVALHENARQSYRALARRVSLSAPVVSDRLRRLESRGILQGYMLSLNPAVFHRDDLLVFFHQDEFARQDALKALAASNVAWVSWKMDGGLTVGVWPPSGVNPTGNIAAAVGAKPSGHALAEHHTDYALSIVDLSIIEALIDEPRRPFASLCDSTGLSPKTVRKHLDLMIRTETIVVEPRLGALADSGDLVYQLAVFGRVGMDELRKILGHTFLLNQTREPPAKSLLCLANDLGEVSMRTRTVGKLAGVESVRITLNRELLVATGFVHSLVRGRIQQLEKARGGRISRGLTIRA